MDIADFEDILRAGESSTVEFKRCGGNPEHDTYETICSFANHAGGAIFLGVKDDGTVLGVPEKSALSIERNIANVTGQPQSFSPTLFVETERFQYDGKTVIRIWVPPTSSVFRYKGQIWDRVADADRRIDGEMQITQMYIRKQNIFTEQHIYPGLSFEDLDSNLIARIRAMAESKTPDHPWGGMDDRTLLRSARLYARDYGSKTEGLTLAAGLLLGKDEVIADLLPAYKTDAVVRRDDLDRYDDRLIVRTNLIDAYEQLSAFMRKSLPDSFHAENGTAVSARDWIVRELVSNILVHREYSSPVPAQIIISDEGIETRNASRPVFEGEIDLDNFTPVPKNPVIADVFMQIGLAEELGSGVRNLRKYTKLYSGGEPRFHDGLMFTAFVPVRERDAEHENKVGRKSGEVADVAAISIEDAVKRLLSRHDEITIAQIAQLSGSDVRAVRRKVGRLVEKGYLVALGRTRNRRYMKAEETVSH